MRSNQLGRYTTRRHGIAIGKASGQTDQLGLVEKLGIRRQSIDVDPDRIGTGEGECLAELLVTVDPGSGEYQSMWSIGHGGIVRPDRILFL